MVFAAGRLWGMSLSFFGMCLSIFVCVCLCVCVLWISVFVFGAVETKAQAASADTFKHRMEQLDDLEEVSMCACA